MPVETPDHLIGIGGHGSGAVENFMSRDWIIHDLVKRQAEGDDVKLKARTIDSATGDNETNRRRTAESDIKENIENKRDSFDLDVPQGLELAEYSDVNFKHYNYIEDTRHGMTDQTALTQTQNVNENIISNSKRLGNCWWVKDHPDLLSSGFGNGVNRRRALSKALYHVSSLHAENRHEHPQNHDVQSNENVTMVVTLGGGTGSGSFIDIATDINEDAEIHLFAVIPDAGQGRGKGEGGDELASAHAALSELEYMEMTGESPFTTITLVPYLQQSDIKDEDFEDALAHTILAHQNVMQDNNGWSHLVPGQVNAIPETHPFNIAVPRIIRYDAGMRWRAQDDVDKYIEKRQHQLEIERGLYETVESFLKENFKDSFGLNLTNGSGVGFDLEDQEQEDHIHSMAVRLEDRLQGALLADENLRVAGIEVDEIIKAIEGIYASQFDIEHNSTGGSKPVYKRVEEEDTQSVDYAHDIVEQLPVQLLEMIQPEEFEEGLDRRFAELIVQEVDNVRKRFTLLRAIYSTDTEQVDTIQSDRLLKLRTALTDVVLDHNSRKLIAEFPNRDIEQIKQNLWGELCENELNLSQLELFEQSISENIKDIFNTWFNESAADEFDIIENYHKKHDEIADILNQLNDACNTKAINLSDEELPARQVGTQIETGEGEVVEINRVNNLLDDVGVETKISSDEIKDDISSLISAKGAHEDYHSGFSLFGNNDEDEKRFTGHKTSVNRNGRFNITTDVENSFNVEYEMDYSNIVEDVDRRYEKAVQTVIDKFEDLITNEENVLNYYSIEELIEQEDVVSRVRKRGSSDRPDFHFDQYGYMGVEVPQNEGDIWTHVDEMSKTLNSLEAGEISGGHEIKQKLGIGRILDERGPVILDSDDELEGHGENIANQYLEPVRNEIQTLSNELERLGSDYETKQVDGAYQAVARLVQLANNRKDSISDGNVELAHPADGYYGLDFTMEYEHNHKIPATESRGLQRSNAFLRTRKAERRDLVDDPEDVKASDIWPRRKDDILEEFALSIEDLVTNQYDRLPVDLDKLEAPIEGDVVTQFRQLRLFNTYMSRSFDGMESESVEPYIFEDDIRPEIEEGKLNTRINDKDAPRSKIINYGDEWTFSVITFLSAFTLDMLEPVITDDGYAETYETKSAEATYPWRNHSFALEGNWSRWDSTRSRVIKEYSGNENIDSDIYTEQNGSETIREEIPGLDWWPHGGVYLWRSELASPGKVCAWTTKTLDDDEALSKTEFKNKIKSNFGVKAFESTVDIE